MEKKKKTYIEIAVLIFILIGAIIYNIIVSNIRTKELEQKKAKFVTDPSTYYTVLGCANKFINFVQNGDTKEIISILDSDYINKYDINETNLMSHVPKLESDALYSYIGETMKYVDLNEHTTKYFVTGKLRKNVYESSPIDTDYDLTVILYKQNRIYSVILESDTNEN